MPGKKIVFEQVIIVKHDTKWCVHIVPIIFRKFPVQIYFEGRVSCIQKSTPLAIRTSSVASEINNAFKYLKVLISGNNNDLISLRIYMIKVCTCTMYTTIEHPWRSFKRFIEYMTVVSYSVVLITFLIFDIMKLIYIYIYTLINNGKF